MYGSGLGEEHSTDACCRHTPSARARSSARCRLLYTHTHTCTHTRTPAPTLATSVWSRMLMYAEAYTRQHTPAYVIIRYLTLVASPLTCMHAEAYRLQHTSAYVSIRQHTLVASPFTCTYASAYSASLHARCLRMLTYADVC